MKGNALAQLALGEAYRDGEWGADKDMGRARVLLEVGVSCLFQLITLFLEGRPLSFWMQWRSLGLTFCLVSDL